MTPSWHEAPISLDKLDDHLKALLRLKIREFVHLSPWFKDTSAVESSIFSSSKSWDVHVPVRSVDRQVPCLQRKHFGRARRTVRLPLRARVD